MNWGLLGPIGFLDISGPKGLYGKLSKSVHASYRFTDVGRRPEDEFATFYFRPPAVRPVAVQEFQVLYNEVVDIGTLIQLNLCSVLLSRDYQVELKERFNELRNSDLFSAAALPYSTKVLSGLAI